MFTAGILELVTLALILAPICLLIAVLLFLTARHMKNKRRI